MKDAMSGNMLFMIVIFFVLLFTGYLCLSINHSRAFDVKNSIIRVIERRGVGKESAEALEGDPDFLADITEELTEAGYRTRGECEEDWVGFNGNGNVDNNNPIFCVRYVSAGSGANNPNGKLHYFQVETFYHFDLPVIRSVFHLSIKGDTKPMN